ncbi:MAG: hypothetical protein JRN66_06965 [Nitrososphaerota archaeon]|nr:hypothetical protein [Nitrososphaerota archaeon]
MTKDTATIRIDFNGSPGIIVDGKRWYTLTTALNAQILLQIGSRGRLVQTDKVRGAKHQVQTWEIPLNLLKMIDLACHSTRFSRKVEKSLCSGDLSDIKGANAELDIVVWAKKAITEDKPIVATQPNGDVLTVYHKVNGEWVNVVSYKTKKHFIAIRTTYISDITLTSILSNPIPWIGRALRAKWYGAYSVIKFDGTYYSTNPSSLRTLETEPVSVFDGKKLVKIRAKSFRSFPLLTPEFGKTIYTAIKYDVDVGAAESLR